MSCFEEVGMKVLVTGGAGFIGSNLVHKLLRKGHEVGVYDNFSNYIDKSQYFKTALAHRAKLYNNNTAVQFKADICNINELLAAMKSFKPEIVVHLAAIAMARPLPKYASMINPINMMGTLNVLDAFNESPYARRIVYASSSMAYGHFTQTPQPEEVILNPTNVYGAAKAAGEYFVKLTKKEWVIVRATSVYGYTDAANRVTQLLLDAAMTNSPAWVVRGETLDLSYVEDVTEGYLRCIESPNASSQIFNISYGEARTAVEFAEELKRYFPKLEYEVREPTIQQVYRGALDIQKARRLLDFESKYSIEDGVRAMVKLALENDWAQEAYKTEA
jgi:nucleoside-diphosphate-sugar epimerase